MTTITALPPAPTRGDPVNFAAQADAFVGALPTLRNEINAVAGEINDRATAAAASAINASTAATAAANSAVATAIAAHNADGSAHGGVGGAALVVHTLSTLPGHAIVPDVVVANYTAFDAYIATFPNEPSGAYRWVEVTTGQESGVTEIWRLYRPFGGAVELHGPAGAWVKNPKYELGTNGENVLVIDAAAPPSLSSFGSSKTVPIARGDIFNADMPRTMRRFAGCPPVYANPALLTGGKSVRVLNKMSNESEFLLVVGASSSEPDNNGLSSVFNTTANATAITGAGTGSGVFFEDGGVVRLDESRYSGFGGIPARYSTTSIQDDFLMTRSQADRCVVEWDYASPSTTDTFDGEGTAVVTLYASMLTSAFNVPIATNTAINIEIVGGGFRAFLIYLTNAGAHALTWPAGTKFENGVEPAWTAVGKDVAGCMYDGTNWIVVRIAEAVA